MTICTRYHHLYRIRLRFKFIAWILITPIKWSRITFNDICDILLLRTNTFLYTFTVVNVLYFSMNIPLFSWSLLCWFILFPYQAIGSLSNVSLSKEVVLMSIEMEEDIRKEQNKILHGNTNSLTRSCMGLCQEKFIDTKEVISDCKMKHVIQCNEKRTKGQTMICKTLHKKQRLSNMNSTKNWGWTWVLRGNGQFLHQ